MTPVVYNAVCTHVDSFDPLPAPGDQEMGITPWGDKLYHNTTPEINSLEQRNQLKDGSGWYRRRGHYYLKGSII
jgi:hypothetical protein